MQAHTSSIASIHVGEPESMGLVGAAAWYDEAWTSAIFKRAISGPVTVSQTGLAGDRQADTENHGGPSKAICVYPAAHYPAWRSELADVLSGDPFAFGAFGENLTVLGLLEPDVCIGDTFTVGDVVAQVSQPRQPCWKLARKWRIKDLTARAVATGRTGWYFRVLQEGRVTSGDRLILRDRPHPTWTIATANLVMHQRQGDASALASLDELSESWKRTLHARIAEGNRDR